MSYILDNILKIRDRVKFFSEAYPGAPTEMAVRSRFVGGSSNPVSGGFPDDMEPNAEASILRWVGSPGRPGIASRMMRDPHVRSSVNMIANPLLNAIWDFEPASESNLDLEVADFMRHVFFERLNFDRFVKQCVTAYCRDGFALFEITDDVESIPEPRFPNHPGAGMGVVTTGMHYRPAWSVYKWHQSKKDPNAVKGIEQVIPGSDAQDGGLRIIPANRVMRWSYDQEDANYWGMSVLRSAYGAFRCKRSLQILQMIKNERMAVPIPKLELPEDASPDDIDVAEQILRDLKSNERGYLITPFGYKFEYAGITTGAGTPIEEAIEQCNRDIAINIMAGFSMLGLTTTGSGGSYALAQTQEGQFQISIESHSRFLMSVFNSHQDGWNILNRLVAINYGPGVASPRLVFRNLPTKNWANVLPVVYNLGQGNMITPDDKLEDFIREVLTLPKRDESTARSVAQEKQEQEDSKVEE